MLLALAIATLVAVSVLIARSHAREHRSALALALEGLRNRALLRSASDGVQILDRRGRVQGLHAVPCGKGQFMSYQPVQTDGEASA